MKNKFKRKGLNLNQKKQLLKQLKSLNSDLISRSELMGRLGKSFKGDRDLYDSLGWPKHLDINDYVGMYSRFGIAAKVVNIFPDGCWKYQPTISENDIEQTEFENQWEALVKSKKVFHYLHRVDILSGIGRYGILLLGFDDGLELSEPCVSAKRLLYMQTYREGQVEIKTFDNNTKSERYGRPEMYSVQLGLEENTKTIEVHHSRVIHVAEGLMSNEWEGQPRMKNVYNFLYNLQMVDGSSGEMFWRGAFGGLAFERDPEADYEDDQAEDDVEEEIFKYIHGFQRHMNFQGVRVNAINQTVIAPSPFEESYISMICASKNIPKRIFLGSEMGELASSQDKENWNDQLTGRNINHCEPAILRPFIDKLIEVGVLPQPQDEYTIVWKDLNAPSDSEKHDNAKKAIEGLSQYINSGVDTLIPPPILLRKYYGYTQEEIDTLMENLEQFLSEREDEKEKQDERFEMEKERMKTPNKFKRKEEI